MTKTFSQASTKYIIVLFAIFLVEFSPVNGKIGEAISTMSKAPLSKMSSFDELLLSLPYVDGNMTCVMLPLTSPRLSSLSSPFGLSLLDLVTSSMNDMNSIMKFIMDGVTVMWESRPRLPLPLKKSKDFIRVVWFLYTLLELSIAYSSELQFIIGGLFSFPSPLCAVYPPLPPLRHIIVAPPMMPKEKEEEEAARSPPLAHPPVSSPCSEAALSYGLRTRLVPKSLRASHTRKRRSSPKRRLVVLT